MSYGNEGDQHCLCHATNVYREYEGEYSLRATED